MTPITRAILRGLVIAGGAAVGIASVLAFRRADWPVYAVFLLVQVLLFIPYVEVLPGVKIGIAPLAATIGFLYIGGLPIIVLAEIPPACTRLLRETLPESWKQRVPQLQRLAARRDLMGGGAELGVRLFAEISMFALGLGVRWWIVSLLAPRAEPAAAPWAIAIAELGGQSAWGVLSILPIYPDTTFLPLSLPGGLRTALTDMALIVGLSVTSFVFLILYGYRAEGLFGAAAWSLAALALHFMLKRLTERRLTVEEQNRRLEALNRELEHRERLSAIGKMSSVVSHQILQQLGVIGLQADLIRTAAGSGDAPPALAQARQNAVEIEEALGDVNRVLTDLLVFSKDLRLNLYEHSLSRVIEECIEECHAEAAEQGVTLRAECPAGVSLAVDKLKMKQALVNVVRNAVEVSLYGSEVVVRAGMHDGYAQVAVSDCGPGVPEQDREAIFTPFFTTKDHGTGLGLAIAREFTEAHGGRLWVEGRGAGSGATFMFQLPLRRD
ncbi:MAG TPA: HAMP domain-containing sensor histidine kinase [Candidatus Binatia bacterium]|nr:HAMP domain-containing sensor histidine kinase [Candidatus Binatia bacterium]